MKRLEGFVVGIIVTVLLLSGTPVFADSINALFNVVNIKINGEQVANIGGNYTLDNGEQVPFSISYKGTTYLPLRKLSELLGKDVDWNNETKTASVSDKVTSIPTPTPEPTTDVTTANPTPTPKKSYNITTEQDKDTVSYIGETIWINKNAIVFTSDFKKLASADEAYMEIEISDWDNKDLYVVLYKNKEYKLDILDVKHASIYRYGYFSDDPKTATQYKWSKDIWTKIASGDLWIGMTGDMAKLVMMDDPNKINSSVGSWGTHEQWVYNKNWYLYFENGKLTSWQN